MPGKVLSRKVLVYCVRDGHLLVLRHPTYPWEQVGIQVPGGDMMEGEDVLAAGLRELVEETGRDCFVIEGVLGTDWYDVSPYRDELQERWFLRAHPTADLPERWMGQEAHEGKAPPTPFEFFWIPLEHAHVLQSGQGSLVWRLVERWIHP